MAAPMDIKSGGSPEIPEVKCAGCGKKQKIMKRCTRCRSIFYCSRDCQIQDWPKHKLFCQREESSSFSTASGLADDSKHAIFDSSCSSSTLLLAERLQESVSITDSAQTPSDNQPGAQPKSKDSPEKSDVDTTCQEPSCKILVKCQREKHFIHINPEWEAARMISHISEQVRIPVEKLKLVHRGKLMDERNIRDCVKERAVFQAIGEVSESEEGLNPSHVDLVVSKLGVGRNEAIRALRLKGDIIDAILYLGNK